MGNGISSVSSAIAAVLAQNIPQTGPTAELAFEPIGLPVDPADFEGSQMQAAAAVDALADVTAKVVDGQYLPTLISATGLFDLMLSGVAATAANAATYGQLLNQAQETYYSGSTDTVTSPGTWWDPASPGWTAYSTSSGQPAGPGKIEPIAGAPWTWRVLPAGQRTLAASSPPFLFKPITPLSMTRLPLASVTTADRLDLSPAPADAGAGIIASPPAIAITIAQEPAAGNLIAPSHLFGIVRGQLAGLASVSTPVPVQASQLSVSFEYTTVALNRSWWNGLLATNTSWYVPGYQAGDLASGSLAGGGLCGGLPTAMVLIRNLTISGSWTSADQSALVQAATFGPFSLLGRTIDSSLTVQVAGAQIAAWVVTELPQLPPLGDPAIGPSASPDPLAQLPVLAKGATGPFVGRAQALLGALLAPGTPGPPVTDTFDAATVLAVEAFQNATHIASTGEVDLATWHQLTGI